jgi:hypothetical protein
VAGQLSSLKADCTLHMIHPLLLLLLLLLQFWTRTLPRLPSFMCYELSNLVSGLARLGAVPTTEWMDACGAAAAKQVGRTGRGMHAVAGASTGEGVVGMGA